MDQEFIDLLKQGRFNELKDLLKSKIFDDPENFDLRKYLALVYQQAGDHFIAISIYEKLMEERANDPILLVNFGQSLKSITNYERAILVLEKVLELNEQSEINPQVTSMAHTNLGAIYKEMYEFDKAVEHYKIARAVDPFNELAKKYFEKLIEQGRQGLLQKKMLPNGQIITVVWKYKSFS